MTRFPPDPNPLLREIRDDLRKFAAEFRRNSEAIRNTLDELAAAFARMATAADTDEGEQPIDPPASARADLYKVTIASRIVPEADPRSGASTLSQRLQNAPQMKPVPKMIEATSAENAAAQVFTSLISDLQMTDRREPAVAILEVRQVGKDMDGAKLVDVESLPAYVRIRVDFREGRLSATLHPTLQHAIEHGEDNPPPIPPAK